MGIDELRTDHGCPGSCGCSAVTTATTTNHALHRGGGKDSHSPTAVDDEMSLGSRALIRRTVSLGAQPAGGEGSTCRV